ncbi:Peroxidase 48-like [Dorcoceras hygrometricum]|uniref:Peroxidase 48-like n=1 Tax=Dorcoceras hygrometricum TaxID=472368 RepID=A0A2Z7BN13_9LAMI|nr:Peroxidase 48-like [Dorcoceras hygrometricum]
MGIDQLALHSIQLGYLKILQMGNADPNNTKAGKQIRGQASGYQGSDSYTSESTGNHLSRASIPRTAYQPGKSSVRDHSGPSTYHSSVVFCTTPMIALCHSGTTSINNEFKAQNSKGCSPKKLKSDRTNSTKVFEQHSYFASLPEVDSDLQDSINQESFSRGTQRHQFHSKRRRKSANISGKRFRMNSINNEFKAQNSKGCSPKKLKSDRTNSTKVFEQHSYFASLPEVDSDLQDSINQESFSRGTQRHQFHSKRRRKSANISGKRGTRYLRCQQLIKPTSGYIDTSGPSPADDHHNQQLTQRVTVTSTHQRITPAPSTTYQTSPNDSVSPKVRSNSRKHSGTSDFTLNDSVSLLNAREPDFYRKFTKSNPNFTQISPDKSCD